jgi:hypothetical protein
MKNNFNLLEAIRTRYVNVIKMIPLSAKIRDRLFEPLAMNAILAQGRVTKLAWRIKLTGLFFDFILKYASAHGSPAAVKWLKGSAVAIQKELGQDRLDSLLALGTALPYSRMTGGLPRLIPAQCRKLIRNGDTREIRFWLGLFNLYRILKVPGELKLQTITSPFTGNPGYLEYLCGLASKDFSLMFNALQGFERIQKLDLSPKGFILSRAASPSSKVSALGILSDIYLLNKYQPDLWQELLYYLYAVKPKVTSFVKDLQIGYELINRVLEFDNKVLIGVKSGKELYQSNHLQLKAALRAHGFNGEEGEGLSQFAIKEEAAGKIRLFALLDSVTQSCLAPLHELLFSLLRIIPNDGTFDQEGSIERSQVKAVEAGCAYSFDLTAATDRIPAKLTAQLLQSITGKEIAESWLAVMTSRNFWLPGETAGKLGVSAGPYRYAVGQPMGGLSSWAGLAITHHWIVQIAALRVTGRYSWNTQYEILGDDLVIFNRQIADQYLLIMQELGCEINLSKSIVSHRRPVFEFAKRTCWGPNIVSGISLAQVRAGWRVAGRVANVLSFARSGLITSPSLLATTLSRYTFNNGKSAAAMLMSRTHNATTTRLFALSILSLFGTFYQSGKMSLKELMTVLVNPHYEDADYSGEAVGLPLTTSLKAAYEVLNGSKPAEGLVWPSQEARDEVFKEYSPELSTVMLQTALKKSKVLYENYELYVQKFARGMIIPVAYKDSPTLKVPMEDLPEDYSLLMVQLENFANHLLGLEFNIEHPEELYDELYDLAYKHAKAHDRLVTFEQASKWLDKVERMEFTLSLPEKEKPGRTVLESAPILAALRNMDPNRNIRPSYIEVPVFKTLSSV